MERISQILIVMLLIIKFKPQIGHVIADLQNEDIINKNYTNSDITIYTSMTYQGPAVEEIITSTAAPFNVLEESNVDNKSLKYLIEQPSSNSNSSHDREVIIKPLEATSAKLEANSSSHEQISANLVNYSEQSPVEGTTQNLNLESKIFQNNSTDAQTDEGTAPSSYGRNEELIINLLDESMTSSNTSENKTKFTISFEQGKSTMSSIQIRINALKKISKLLTNYREQEVILKPIIIENQSTVTPNKDTINSTAESIEDLTLRIENKQNLYAGNAEREDIMESIKDYEVVPEQKENPTISLVQTIVSSSSAAESEERANVKATLEDYAVKQMNFILDYILLESQDFVAKVLQATGNAIFQRDYLKRYAESLNRLLNPAQLDSDYNDTYDTIFDTNSITQEELFEQVVKKLSFLKSKAELQRHLPAGWVKDYKEKREELKFWLNKASEEMHRVFNLYVDDEEDHIKYLYFNEAFDDISRATEIHQKLALLADLIQIVKNKKQITFMDLYMQ